MTAMTPSRLAPLLLVAIATVSCSSSKDGPSAPPCNPDGVKVFALGATCLHLDKARVRSGGAWQELPAGSVTIENVGDAPAGVAAIAVTMKAKAPAEAFELTVTGAKGSALLQQGYQSWSFSGAAKIPADVPRAADGSLAAAAGSTGAVQDEAQGVSYGAALVGDPGGRALAVGPTSSTVATTAIAATAPAPADGASSSPTVTILYGVAREPLPAGPDGNVTTPAILLAASDRGNDALALLAARTKKALPADARVAKRPPGGWFSWNELFATVDEAAVKAHIDLVATKLLPLGMPLVEIDDGWELAWGDWKENTKFPGGMAALGKAIKDKGLVPGVWLAPFLVDTTSEAAAKLAPALFVKGADGKPLVHRREASKSTYYVLDGTNPEAMASVGKPIADLAAAGFGYFKLDFLYAGALPGGHLDANATGVQALRAGLSELRKAMGDAAVLDACGAPIFPVLGLADALRIGNDTAFGGLSLNWAEIVFAARSTSARAFLWPVVFPDGDQVQVRDPYTLDEAHAAAFVAAMSGAAYALGDDLRKLPADRLAIALDPTVLDLAGASTPALPDDPLEGPAESIVVSPILDTVKNPGSTGAPPPSRFTAKGKSGATYHLTFAWTDIHKVDVTK
jgi:alpha-galactosidase